MKQQYSFNKPVYSYIYFFQCIEELNKSFMVKDFFPSLEMIDMHIQIIFYKSFKATCLQIVTIVAGS